MDEKKDNTNTNFEIHREFSRKKVSETIALMKQLELQTSERVFDTSRQNLWVACFHFTLDSEPFLAQIEKVGLSVPELAKAVDQTKTPAQQLTRFYLVYNYFYFSKISERNLGFVQQTHFSFRSALRSTTALPTFPILKLFLSKMNYFANTGNNLRYFEHTEEIHRVLEYARDFKPLRQQRIGEGKFVNSCTYGGTFYHLGDVDQQSINPLEIEVAGNIMLVLTQVMAKNVRETDAAMNEVKRLQASLKDNSSASSSESKAVVRSNYEARLRTHFIDHIDAAVQFLELLKKIRFESGIDLNQLLTADKLFRGHQLKKKYSLGALNLVAVSNFKGGNVAVASKILARLCDKVQEIPISSLEKRAVIVSLSQLNNPLMRAPLSFNLFVTLFGLGEFARAIAVAETLVPSFASNHRFWYFKGLSHFNLWLREADAIKSKQLAEIAKIVKVEVRALERRKVSLLVTPDPNVESVVQQAGLGAFRTLDGDGPGRHVVLAISSLESSLNILLNFNKKDSFAQVFQPSTTRFKEQFNALKNAITAENPKHLLTVLEHLTYLYLQVNKPMQALKTLSMVTSGSPRLTTAENARLAAYHLKAAQLLKKPGLSKTSLTQLEAALQSPETGTSQVKISRDGQSCVLPTAFVLKYNRLLVQSRDKDAARSAISKLLEEFGRLSDRSRTACEPLMRGAMFFYHSRVEFSRDVLRQITSPLFDVSKYHLNRNGKTAGGF